MTKPWFNLRFSDEALRRMTREEYYKAHRWRRITQRIMRERMGDAPDISDAFIYGVAAHRLLAGDKE